MDRGTEASGERRDESKLTSWQLQRTLWLWGLVVGQDRLRNGSDAYGEKGAEAEGGEDDDFGVDDVPITNCRMREIEHDGVKRKD